MIEEAWKDIEGYSRYKVSDLGRVWDKQNDTEVSQVLTGIPQYYYVNMYSDSNRRKLVRVHRLVAGAFCDGRTDKYNVVDHINRNPHDNRADNLRWVDHKGNTDNRETTVWYDENTTLKDYCRSRFEDVDNAYAYIYSRHRDLGMSGAVAAYEDFLAYGEKDRKVFWRGEEQFLLGVLNGDEQEYSRVLGRLREGWDVWNAVYNVKPLHTYSFEIKENGVMYWYPSSEYWSNQHGKSKSVLSVGLRGGLSTEEILTKGDTPTYTVKGITGTRKELCKHFGVTESVINTRMTRKGMTFEEALTNPRQRVNVLTINGERRRPADWMREFGLNPKAVCKYKSDLKCSFKDAMEHFGVDTSNLVIEE